MQKVVLNNARALADALKEITELTGSQKLADTIGLVVLMKRLASSDFPNPKPMYSIDGYQLQIVPCYAQMNAEDAKPVNALDVVIEPYTSGVNPPPPPEPASAALGRQLALKKDEVSASEEIIAEYENDIKAFKAKITTHTKLAKGASDETKKAEHENIVEEAGFDILDTEKNIDAVRKVLDTDKALLDNIQKNYDAELKAEKPVEEAEAAPASFKWPAQYKIYFSGDDKE